MLPSSQITQGAFVVVVVVVVVGAAVVVVGEAVVVVVGAGVVVVVHRLQASALQQQFPSLSTICFIVVAMIRNRWN